MHTQTVLSSRQGQGVGEFLCVIPERYNNNNNLVTSIAPKSLEIKLRGASVHKG